MVKDLKLVKYLQSDQCRLQDVALERLYLRNLSSIESLTCQNSGTPEDAKEVLQDALVVVYQSVRKHGFQLTSKLDTYLYSIAKNIWFKQLRKKKREVETVPIDGQGFLLAAPKSPDSALGEQVMLAIQNMSPQCRKILTMIYVEEKDNNETMRAMEYKSLAALRNKKSNCLQKLRSLFHSSMNND